MLLKVFLGMMLAGVALVARADVVPGWLLISPDLRESLVVSNPEEKGNLEKAGWKLEAAAGLKTDGEGAAPLHRLLRVTKTGSDRLLETDVTRLPVWQKAGFKDEGVVGYVADSEAPGRATVIQYAKGDHKLWLVTAETQATAEKAGWKKQGVHFWFFAAPAQ